MGRACIGVLTLAACLLPQCTAWAWHDVGHAAVAAVAWKDLDAGTRRRVADTLRRHQDYAPIWKPAAPGSGLDEGEFLFIKAALWPDAIRENFRVAAAKRHPSRFLSVPSWHYKDRAYIPARQPARKLPENGENAQSTLQHVKEALLHGSNENGVSRTVALCWLFHLVGDVHQPLHAAALLSDDFPEGDRGGNLFLVQHPQKNLHAYWDGLFDLKSRPAETEGRVARAGDSLATVLMQEHPRGSFTELGDPFDFGGWLDESYRLALSDVYSFTNTQGERVALQPGIGRGSTVTREPQPLPAGYDENAHVVARKRVALAGYRLANALRKFFPAAR